MEKAGRGLILARIGMALLRQICHFERRQFPPDRPSAADEKNYPLGDGVIDADGVGVGLSRPNPARVRRSSV